MKEDVWKQDIGQWVERKGRCNWVQQRQPPPPALSSARPAAHSGFIPSDFKERQSHDFSAMPLPSKSASTAAYTAKPQETKDLSLRNMRWVTVHGVSAGGIFDLREYFDVNFGRTLAHVCPEDVCDGALHWLHVKFEDPAAAARAVFQSPVPIPCSAGTRAEEVVGVEWCSDAAFLKADDAMDDGASGRVEGEKMRGTFGETEKEDGDGVSNAAGLTPSGADRLRHHSYHPTTPDNKESPHAFMGNTSSDFDSSWRKSGRSSRGFVSVLRDALRSPWSVSPRKATATPGSVRDTQSDAEIPHSLSATRNFYRERMRHGHRAIPVWPLSGNISVLSAFRADKSQRGLTQRVWQTLRFIILWLSALFTGSLSTVRDAQEAERDFAFGWTAQVRGMDNAVTRHDALLRARHFGAAARARRGGAGFGEVTLAHWVPCRWYERVGVRSLAVLLVLVLLIFCSRSDPGIVDVDVTVRPTGSLENAEKAVTQSPAEAEGIVQLQGTLFAPGYYGSDAYHARTL